MNVETQSQMPTAPEQPPAGLADAPTHARAVAYRDREFHNVLGPLENQIMQQLVEVVENPTPENEQAAANAAREALNAAHALHSERSFGVVADKPVVSSMPPNVIPLRSELTLPSPTASSQETGNQRAA